MATMAAVSPFSDLEEDDLSGKVCCALAAMQRRG